MRMSHLAVTAGMVACSPLLGGCSLEAAMATCATCGEVRSVTPRVVRSEIHLPTPLDAYAPATAQPASGQSIVFHVRVRMDRGGSRDFLLHDADVSIGDRVEVRGDALVPRDPRGKNWS